MDESLEVTNIKAESTESISSNRMEISSELQLNSVKRETDYLVQSEIHIKTEPQEDESEFPIIAGSSYDMCHYDKIKFEIQEPFIRIKSENEIMQDPLDVGCKIKVEEQFPIDLNQSEPRNKIELTGEDGDDNLLEYHKYDSHGSTSNHQDELLIKNNSDRKDKKYVCDECNKTFKQKCDLDRHLRIHTGEKPFICDICKKSYNTKGSLHYHMLVHSGEKSHGCDVCKKFFRNKSHLNDHMLIHSGVKSFSCNECGKLFTLKSHLVTHQRIHTDKKSFACDLCNKAFTHKTNLTRHRRLHSGVKPYSCDICNKSYAQKDGLKYHIQTHKR